MAAIGSLGKLWLATNTQIGGFLNPVLIEYRMRALLTCPPAKYPIIIEPRKNIKIMGKSLALSFITSEYNTISANLILTIKILHLTI